MPSCEKCWTEAGGNARRYAELLKLRSCTPEEQAGDDATLCPKCNRITMHQYAKVCMNAACCQEGQEGYDL